jgi:hypothetical protein
MSYLLIALLVIFPYGVFGAPVAPPTDLKSFLGILNGIINLLIPIIFALTFLTISWGVIKAWIMGDASAEQVEHGKNLAIIGVIVLAVMSAIWGILQFLQSGIFG